MALIGTTCATIRLGESDGRRRWVNGNYSSRGQCATRSCSRSEDDAAQAPLPAWPAGGMTNRHPLTVDAHAACHLLARTGFGIVAGTTCRVVTSGPRWRSHRGAARVFVRKRHPSTRELCCATSCLTGPKMGRNLDLANVAGGEDHSHYEVLDRNR